MAVAGAPPVLAQRRAAARLPPSAAEYSAEPPPLCSAAGGGAPASSDDEEDEQLVLRPGALAAADGAGAGAGAGGAPEPKVSGPRGTVWAPFTPAASPPDARPAAELVEELMEFFSTRLLVKRYRRGAAAAGAAPAAAGGGEEGARPEEVSLCEAAFRAVAERAVAQHQSGEQLDALEWLDVCDEFSARWLEVCHWLSPKKLREFLSARVGVRWRNEEEVPPERELPPRDLKWYKNPEGCKPAQRCVCEMCGVVCNSAAQYRAHAQGTGHRSRERLRLRKKMLGDQQGAPPRGGRAGGGQRHPAPAAPPHPDPGAMLAAGGFRFPFDACRQPFVQPPEPQQVTLSPMTEWFALTLHLTHPHEPLGIQVIPAVASDAGRPEVGCAGVQCSPCLVAVHLDPGGPAWRAWQGAGTPHTLPLVVATINGAPLWSVDDFRLATLHARQQGACAVHVELCPCAVGAPPFPHNAGGPGGGWVAAPAPPAAWRPRHPHSQHPPDDGGGEAWAAGGGAPAASAGSPAGGARSPATAPESAASSVGGGGSAAPEEADDDPLPAGARPFPARDADDEDQLQAFDELIGRLCDDL